jgi:hypothetical protein
MRPFAGFCEGWRDTCACTIAIDARTLHAVEFCDGMSDDTRNTGERRQGER